MSLPVLLPAASPLISCMGRTAPLVGGALRLAFPGIRFSFRYSGPAPVLHLRAHAPDCCFNLSCQGWDPVVLHLLNGDNRIPLPTGRGSEEGWVVELERRTEAWQGIVDFLGLEVPETCRLRPPPVPADRRLLFIGDSITCGENIEYLPAAAVAGPRWTNAGRSYGMLLGKWLGAQVHLVSYGGRGLMRTWENRTDQANAPQFFERAIPDEETPLWDHAQYTPHAIVVCLGTNDFNPGIIEEPVFTAAWLRFLGRVREVHPKAALVLAESPIFPDAPDAPDIAKRRVLRACLEAVAAEYTRRGGPPVVVAPVSKQPGTYLDEHPVAFQHEQIALEILPYLKQVTAW